MKSLEYCLDYVLIKLKENWDVPGAADRKFLDNQTVLVKCEMPDYYLKHEFFKRLIDRLVKDGNAEFISMNNGFGSDNIQYYEQNTIITIQGFFFIECGGYEGKVTKEAAAQKRLFELERRQSRMANRLFWINVTIALGTTAAALYYLNELCKSYHWCSFCH